MSKGEKTLTGIGALLIAAGGCCIMSDGIWALIAGAAVTAGLISLIIGTRRYRYR